MTRLATAAIAALGLSAMVTPMAAAETFVECVQRLEDDCALFVPRGSQGWANCVETLIPFECAGLPGSPDFVSPSLAKVDEVEAPAIGETDLRRADLRHH